jgi:hypothetical protein
MSRRTLTPVALARRTRGANTGAMCALVSLLAALVSLALTAGTAAAAPPSGGGGGGGGSTTTTAPKLTAVAALSRHRLLVSYDKALDATALQTASYSFATASGVLLPVRAVVQGPTASQALLSTDAQEAVTYTVKKPKTPRPVTFTGSLDAEPRLQGASALSSTQVVLDFSEPLGEGADLPASYQITVPGTTRTLAVSSVAKFLGATQILLTTAAQDASTFSVKVGDVKGLSGEYVDPTANSAQFAGSTAPDRGLLLSATPQGDTGLLLTFDRPITAASAADMRSYVTTPNLFVGSATQSADRTQVVLSTGVQYQVQYTIVANVVDTEGQPLLNPLMNSASFMGGRPFSTERPKVTSGASTGNTSVVVQFSKPMADNTPDPSRFLIFQTYVNPEVGTVGIKSAEWAGTDRLSVRLTTYSQAEVTYTVAAHNVTDMLGNPLADKTNEAGVLVDPTSFTFPGTPPTYAPCTKVTSFQTTKQVTMGANARATATGVTLTVNGRSVAGLTTTNGSPVVTSTVAAFTTADVGKDISGPGIPGCIDERVDTDKDGVFDHEETRGWEVTVKLATAQTVTVTNSDGTTTTTTTMTSTRQVTSSPESPDTDNDGLTDYEEKALVLDARDNDTDDDQLTDWGEFNRIFSDPTVQDTDRDSLFDGLEVNFFRTSATLDDTDGDQLLDGTEITLSNRNPRLSDLAKPTLAVGETRLDLDVRFVDEVGGVETVVDSKTETSTLTQSARQEYVNSDSGTFEAGLKLGFKESVEAKAAVGGEIGVKIGFEATQEVSTSGSYTTTATDASAQEMIRAYERTLSTVNERTESANQTRQINAARMQASVMLKSAGDIAFRIKNIQLTAHIQDPQHPDRLTPVATLSAEEPVDGYSLGPLTPPKGPVVFTNETIFPKTVEDLMRNPRGLVFRFSNYDITDEKGRNFAFTSQDVNDRTARLVIDYGGFDRDGDGQGDLSDVLRVATGTGRFLEDTDKDGDLDPIVYDASGKHQGISLREALQAAGFTQYDEAVTPTATLTQAQVDSSYSVINVPDFGERIYRIRRTKRELPQAAKEWQIITPTGLDRSLGLDDVIMFAGQSFSLTFVQDLDRDNLTAATERLNNCSDFAKDSDSDGLDDRFETLVGWTVDTDRGIAGARSRCVSKDTDNDGITDLDEAPRLVERDAAGLVRFDPGHEPKRYVGNEVFDQVSSEAAMLALAARRGDIARRTDIDLTTVGTNLFVLGNGPPTDRTSWVRFFDGVDSEASMLALQSAEPGDLVRRTDSNEAPLPLYVLVAATATEAQKWVRSADSPFTVGYVHEVQTRADLGALPARVGDLARLNGEPGGPVVILTNDDNDDEDPATSRQLWVDVLTEGTTPGTNVLTDPILRAFLVPRLIDPVTNPSSKDTDEDNLLDRYEADPRMVRLYPNGDLSLYLVTSAELFDSDGDTAGDGLEERIGGDPTIRDLENFADNDGDGLTNIEEKQGWKISVEQVSTGSCISVCAHGVSTDIDVTSDPNIRDTDGDGLSDGEERDLNRPERVDPARGSANPRSKDTDGDGLSDLVEAKGYTTPFGILSTDPGDADTDDDKRTDGDEVKKGLIVRLLDGDPYQVFSNPTKADADFDRLVDGDEVDVDKVATGEQSSDPSKANTDGDNRDDYYEVNNQRDPLVPDLKVTMRFDRLVITKDAEGDSGDFTFSLSAAHKKRDGTETSQLAVHSYHQAIDGVAPLGIAECGSTPCRPDVGDGQTFPSFGPEDHVISMDAGQSLIFNRNVTIGTVSTSANALEQIEVRGNLIEWDGAAHTSESIRFDFPDPYISLMTDGTGIVRGTDLKTGTNSMAIHRTGNDSEGSPLDFTLLVSYFAE